MTEPAQPRLSGQVQAGSAVSEGAPVALNWSVTAIARLRTWSPSIDGLPDGAPLHAPGTYWASVLRLGAVASRH